MTVVPRRPQRRAAALLALLACALGAAVLVASPVRADDQTVTLGADAPPPVSVFAGERVTFVNGEDRTHRVTSTERDGSAAWSFDSGDLAQGQSASFVFTNAGTYAYTDQRAGSLRQVEPPRDQPGTVTVLAAPAATTPGPGPSAPAPAAPAPAAPAPGPAAPAPAGPAPAAPAPAPVPPAGTGVTGMADLPGLLGGFQVLPPSAADAAVLPPAVAGLLDQLPAVADAPRQTVLAVAGPLPGSPTSRPLGLPATVAALAVAGVVSLLVRVLLAEPAAARRPLVPVAVG